MEEKQQKKIKASPRPGMLAGYLTNFLASVELAGMSTNRYQANFPASEEADGRKAAKEDQGLTEAEEVGRVYDMISLEKVPGKLPCLGEAARSMHLCAPNTYHNTENETLHCGEAERGSGDCACAGGKHAARWVL